MGILFLPIKLAIKLATIPLKLVGPAIGGLIEVVVMILLLPFKVLASLVSAVSGSGRKGEARTNGPGQSGGGPSTGSPRGRDL